MAGHSKWAQIKRKKAVTDAARSKVFAKYARLITVEVKKARGNADSPSVRSVVDRARAENMPKENIERAIERASGKEAETLEEVVYEFYGPGGSAIMVTATTDNRNRTTQEIKHLLSKRGFALGAPGSVLWAFVKDGNDWTPIHPTTLSMGDQSIFEELLEALDEHDDVQNVYANVA